MKKLTKTIFNLLLVTVFVVMGCAIKPEKKEAFTGKSLVMEGDRVREDLDEEFMEGTKNALDVIIIRQQTILRKLTALINSLEKDTSTIGKDEYLMLMAAQAMATPYQIAIGTLDRVYFMNELFKSDYNQKDRYIVTAAQTTAADTAVAMANITGAFKNLDEMDHKENHLETVRKFEELRDLFETQYMSIIQFYKIYIKEQKPEGTL